jgi:hypothetical protein
MIVKFTGVRVFQNGRFPLILQSAGTTVHTICCILKISVFWPHGDSVFFMRFPGQIVIIALSRMHLFVFVMESQGVFCEVGI